MKRTKSSLFLLAIAAACGLSSCQTPSSDQDLNASLQSYLKGLPFEMPAMQAPVFPATRLSITECGGIGDGHADNTRAFADAMRQLEEQSGGHLVVPRGVWFTGPITFESNVDLHLEDGAVILFSITYSSKCDKYVILNSYMYWMEGRCKWTLN